MNPNTETLPVRHRRWPWAAGVLALATVAVAAGVGLVTRGPNGESVDSWTAWHAQTQLLLAAPMQARPVAGWRTELSDLGLRLSEDEAHENKFATSADPFYAKPYVGNIGDNAYFIVGNPGAPTPQWWLAGVNVLDGKRLFDAIHLSTAQYPPQCSLNGTVDVLCLSGIADTATAWVIDGNSGNVRYTGPTDLTPFSSKFIVKQFGIYTVAQTQHQGVFGTGPRAETTWFVPGGGTIDSAYLGARDFPPATLASQRSGQASIRHITLSLIDGTVIKPEIADGESQEKTVIYPGGFAAEIGHYPEHPRTQFFDNTGKRVGPASVTGRLATDKTDLPVIAFPHDGWAIYTPQGGKLLQRAGPAPRETRLIGDNLFVMIDAGWRNFDLRTGTEGKPCSYPIGDGAYLASDGKVAVTRSGNANVGLKTKAVDLSTCDTLWTLSSPTGSFRDVWRINTTLVQLSDDGTELTSLVAPGRPTAN